MRSVRRAVPRLARFYVVCSALFSACHRGPPKPLAPEQHPLAQDWLILPQPESGLEVGVAWPLVGGLALGCYSMRPRTDSVDHATYDRYMVQWKDSSYDSLTARLAKLLRLDTILQQTASGRIRFSSLKIRRALNLGPLPTCSDVDRYGVPTLPAIEALIGAESLTVEAENSRHEKIDGGLDYRNVGATVRHEGTRQDSTVLGFDSFRWIGVHLVGFQLDTGGFDSTVIEGRWGSEWLGLPPKWGLFDVRARTIDVDKYVVESQRRLPNALVVVDTVEGNGANFFLGLPRSSDGGGHRGDFFTGRIWDLAESKYRLLIEHFRYVDTVWTKESQKADMQTWWARRRRG